MVRERADYIHFALNSIIISVGATLLAIADRRAGGLRHGLLPGQADQGSAALDAVDQDDAGGRRADPDLPAVPGLGAIDTRWGLTIVYTLMNLPIVVWMLYTFFKEVPKDILEAGRMDGAKPKQEVWMLLLPLSLPGIASTALLSIILCWNEAFWSLNLTDLERGAADHVHRLVLRPGRACSGPSSRPPRRSRSPPSSCSAG